MARDPGVWTEVGEHRQVLPGRRLTLELVGVADFPRDRQGREHAHPFWEILLPLVGRMDLLAASGDRRLEAGRPVLLPPACRHAVRARGGPLRVAYLGVGLDAAGLLADAPRPVDPAAAAGFCSELGAAVVALEAGEQTDDLRLLTAAARLLELAGVAPRPAPRTPAQRLVATVRRLLADRLDATVNVTELAADLYLSPGHLGEVFSRETGQTIKAYHRSLRLQEAASRLLRADATPGGVAAELGYPTVQAFSRDFRGLFGSSPTAWRAARTAGSGPRPA